MTTAHGGNVFAVAKRHGWDWREIADFSASINPLGPSACVRPAIVKAMDRIMHYPETDAASLRRALADAWDIAPDNIVAGNGATELIHYLARTLQVDSVALAAPVFSEFHRAYPNAAIVDFDSRAWPDHGLIVVTRPANPTGAMPILGDYLRNTTNPVIIDESFIEFTAAASLVGMVQSRPSLYVLRSLTKFHAIPGLRVGAVAGPVDELRRWSREPWSVNVLAEAAVIASLGDTMHATQTVVFVNEERDWLLQQLAQIAGVRPLPSAANFLLLDLDRPVQPIARALELQQVLVRDCSGWPGVKHPNAMRVAVRPRIENLRLIEGLKGALCES